MRTVSIVVTAALLPAAAFAQTAPDPGRLKADVDKLVSFGTRHTMSDPVSPKRGLAVVRIHPCG